MTGKVVTVSSLDSVRIEVLGEGRALTIPAKLILAIDGLLKLAMTEDDAFSIDQVEDDESGWVGWELLVGDVLGWGDTPWGAIEAATESPRQRPWENLA